MSDLDAKNKRLAKNTVYLYLRTVIVMIIALYTSRVILKNLGIEDYGIYQAVGGIVGMMTIISSSLSTSIIRFLTFELGAENNERLKKVFSTSVVIQLILGVIVFIVGEVSGIWFIENRMQIPPAKIYAAEWVLTFSLISFIISLVSVPYNACIIAHERMKAFAYVSLYEAIAKLVMCYVILIAPSEKLILYAFLLMAISISVRIIYGYYCHKNFPETRIRFVFDRSLMKEMFGFAGWSFFSNTSYILDTQGINLLINMYFGVTLNAARGITSQVGTAVTQFCNSYSTAINPQITKDYAAGNYEEFYKLICRGAKFTIFLLMIFSFPIIFETETILNVWLNKVPEDTAVLIRLSLICTIITSIGGTGTTACMATGKIKTYVIVITSVSVLIFPLTWLAYSNGAPVQSTYYIYMVVFTAVLFVRLFIMRSMFDFPIRMFLKEVLLKIIIVGAVSIVLPLIIVNYTGASMLRAIIVIAISLISTLVSIAFLGLSRGERNFLDSKIRGFIHR